VGGGGADVGGGGGLREGRELVGMRCDGVARVTTPALIS
jgi:hypothetical protein